MSSPPPGDPFALADLEFDGVRALVAARTRTAPGEALARLLHPSTERREVEERLRRLGEAMALAEDGRLPGVPALGDPAEALSRLAIEGAVLEAEQLRELSAFVAAATELEREVRPHREVAPALHTLAAGTPDLSPFAAATRGVFSPDGGIEDRASPELAKVRARIASVSERLRRDLRSTLDAPGSERWLQDEFVTIRNNRFVIPVRADSRPAVEGIVHGASASGATLFVEPLSTVGLNNELVRMREEEASEIRRILTRLSDLARGSRAGLRVATEVVATLDVTVAATRLGREFGARPAILTEGRTLMLEEARHLLLEARLRPTGARATPISIHLEDDARVLVISGPNTGGKTVALKTVGLAALMTQAGLPIPAAAARLPLFGQVLADIGDHQSIAENLSTFSSHVTALVRMTSQVTGPALVLIDELGTGTDPEEGAALGIAVVEYFRGRDALVLVTTHHNGLKAYAGTTPGVVNASVEFDEERLRPTYRLTIGVAGRSGGLDIAGRLGLSAEILATARRLVSDQGRRTEDYLAHLATLTAKAEEARRATEAERQAAEMERQAALEDRRQGAARLERRLATAAEEARHGFDRALSETLARLQRNVDRERLRREAERAKVEFSRRLRAEAERAAGTPTAAASTVEVRPGDRIAVGRLRLEGLVERIAPGGEITVSVAGKRVVVPAGEVTRLPAAVPPPRPAPTGGLEADPTLEINLIGLRAAEAIHRLDRSLDDALAAGGREVRVVHGHGTGRLKKAIREHLPEHPAVASFRPGGPGEGGDGATIVALKD